MPIAKQWVFCYTSFLGSTRNSVETFKVFKGWNTVLNTYQNLEN